MSSSSGSASGVEYEQKSVEDIALASSSSCASLIVVSGGPLAGVVALGALERREMR